MSGYRSAVHFAQDFFLSLENRQIEKDYAGF